MEPGGRFSRLDVWFVVVIVLAAMTLRTFRLAEPYSMHFDEVYHARTATEFLQDWRYGIPHDIYEYTHPHLAKYAMAAGLVAFADDQVTSQGSIGVPVRDAALELRWEDPTLPGDRAGDRTYVATGSEIRVYDDETRALVGTIPAPGATVVTVDQGTHRLLIGTDQGHVFTFDTRLLDDLRRHAGYGRPRGAGRLRQPRLGDPGPSGHRQRRGGRRRHGRGRCRVAGSPSPARNSAARVCRAFARSSRPAPATRSSPIRAR